MPPRRPAAEHDVRRHEMPAGAYRRVFLLGGFALKVPRLCHFAGGLWSNRWEREMCRTWQPVFGWRILCPVLFSDPFGFLVVMPRAAQPIDFSEITSLPHAYPDIGAETKAEDYGRFQGRVVALDYGLPDGELVRERRAYYESFVAGNRPHFNGEHDS